ncbi:MAG: Fe-S cluster assembly ATPase SufC [Bacilli bacterium]
MTELIIQNLHVEVEGKEILKGIDLTIKTGEIHALLGPNGHGKSTLLNVLMGHPKYKVTAGTIKLDDEDLLTMTTDERAKKGLFLAFQYPPEISGVSISDFIKTAINSGKSEPISLYKYIRELESATKSVGFDLEMIHRSLNAGFSGGEKKRSEIIQMQMLKPKIVLLDEIDSGLDVDAIKMVGDVLNKMNDQERSFLIVSHYARMYELVKPTFAHVIINGQIVMSGGLDIIHRIDSSGYDWIKKELDIEIKNEQETPTIILESCARVKKDNK